MPARPSATLSNYGKEAAVWPPVDGLMEAAADARGRTGPARPADAHPGRPAEGAARRRGRGGRHRHPPAHRGRHPRHRAARSNGEVAGWQKMLRDLARDTPPEFVDWLAIERFEGHDLDVGMYRHWIDPTVPFAEAVHEARPWRRSSPRRR
jgi:ATP-dependent DNA helicase DinG